MSYPNFVNKHLEKALFGPKDFSAKNILKNFPENALIVYSRHLLDYIKRKYRPKKLKKVIVGADVYLHKNIAIIKMKGIGAPHAVTAFEEIICFGVKNFLNIGIAGGLDDFGIYVCDKAIRDEGASSHYLAHEKYAYPDKKLTEELEKVLQKNKVEYKKGTTWTIDAPYRETVVEVKHYQSEGVKTVEMEASALFAVAKLRGVRVASAFSVSDLVLPGKWEPHFDRRHIKIRLNKLVDSAIELLRGMK